MCITLGQNQAHLTVNMHTTRGSTCNSRVHLHEHHAWSVWTLVLTLCNAKLANRQIILTFFSRCQNISMTYNKNDNVNAVHIFGVTCRSCILMYNVHVFATDAWMTFANIISKSWTAFWNEACMGFQAISCMSRQRIECCVTLRRHASNAPYAQIFDNKLHPCQLAHAWHTFMPIKILV